MCRILIAGGLGVTLIVAALAWPAHPLAAQRAATATPPPTGNLLRNGDFEGSSARQWNALNGEWANGRVADGWTAWWRKPTASDGLYPGQCPAGDAACQPWHRPEYRETRGIPYDPPRVHGGDNSQMIFTSFGVYEGGLYQSASGIPRGWRISFSLWVRAWSSDSEDTSHSTGQPSMHMQIGIDPTGGDDPWSSSVVWGENFDSFDVFSQVSLGAIAQSDTVTVFFRSRPERALKHIDVVLDDAELILLGPPPPTPMVIDSPNVAAGAATLEAPIGSGAQQIVEHIVQPGDTLFAIAQRYRAELSAIYAANNFNEASVLRVGQSIRVPLSVDGPPTPAPTPVPAAPEPVAVGAVCVSAFEDANANGRFDGSERPIPGAVFFIADASGRTIATSATARCFADLPVGAYAASVQMPAGYSATTQTQWGVALTEDARVEVAAGAQRTEDPSEENASGVPSIAVGAGSIVFLIAAMVYMRRRAKS